MTVRCEDEGYVTCAMHDPAGRRGLWARATENAIELCSGREGDDSYVCLREGDTLTAETMQNLSEVLERAHDAWEAGKDYEEKATKQFQALEAEVLRAMLRLYGNDLPSGKRAYQLLGDAVGDQALRRESMPREHPVCDTDHDIPEVDGGPHYWRYLARRFRKSAADAEEGAQDEGRNSEFLKGLASAYRNVASSIEAGVAAEG